MLMNSPLFEEWVKEEREEAAKKGHDSKYKRKYIRYISRAI